MSATKQLHQHLSDVLTELEGWFKDGQVELTFFARHKTIPTAHVFVSNDSFDAIRKGLAELEAQNRPKMPRTED